MLFGEFRHQVDEKGRFRIPAKLREVLGANPFITKGTNKCLFVFSKEDADRIFFEKFKDNDFANSEESRPLRLMTSSAVNAEEDKQGRILLPNHLIRHSGINKNIVIIGAFNRVEIWSEENWEAYINEDAMDFDACLKTIAKPKV